MSCVKYNIFSLFLLLRFLLFPSIINPRMKFLLRSSDLLVHEFYFFFTWVMLITDTEETWKIIHFLTTSTLIIFVYLYENAEIMSIKFYTEWMNIDIYIISRITIILLSIMFPFFTITRKYQITLIIIVFTLYIALSNSTSNLQAQVYKFKWK